jgi:O-antigen/teichoic acid export membrane protein
MSVVYFRVLVILTSLLASDEQTGYFGTSFRVFEVAFGLPLLVLGVALPVLAVAGHEDEERLRYSLQRMTEVALIASVPLVLVIVVLAEPAIVLLGGEEFRDAAPVLQIQALALVGVFLGQTWQLGLLAIRKQSALAWANGAALVLVVLLGLALIPPFGAKGAAVAAVIAEAVLAVLLGGFLHRARPALMPRFGFVPRVVLAAALATPIVFLPLPALPAAGLAAGIFAAVALLTGVLPPELVAAFRRGAAT